jgi:hypothetical protein
MLYNMLDLPGPVRNLQINNELRFQQLQKDYFQRRVKLGPEIIPSFYHPVIEPEEGHLCAIFVAPGENHFVFRDEVAPSRLLDEWYRWWRRWGLGRVADIESIEIKDGKIGYYACLSIANLYETGLHYNGWQTWNGEMYSCTWNHMMNTKPQTPILIRGGYELVSPEIYNGDRDDAEEYAKCLQ